MKKTLLTIFAVSLFLPSLAFAKSAQVSVNGLVCDFCARALEKVFGQEEEVSSIDVNLDTKVITIDFKEGQTMDEEEIKYLITDSGYAVDKITYVE